MMSNDSSMMAPTGPPDSDPFTQTFTLLLPDGTPIPVSLADLDDFYLYAVRISINYAAQLGASLLLLITIALLTQPDKRYSPIFIINVVSLAVNFIRLVLQCLYFTGPFCQIYAVFSGDFSRITQNDLAMSVADSVLSTVLLTLIEVSLLLQAQVVCVTLRKLFRYAIFWSSMMVAAVAIAFRIGFCVENVRYTLTFTQPIGLEWLASATNITTTVSIWWFCAVFVTKLGLALRQRRKLGLRRFGPMQIIFIMGCQTLLVPCKQSFPYPQLTPADVCSSDLRHHTLHCRDTFHELKRADRHRTVLAVVLPLGCIFS